MNSAARSRVLSAASNAPLRWISRLRLFAGAGLVLTFFLQACWPVAHHVPEVFIRSPADGTVTREPKIDVVLGTRRGLAETCTLVIRAGSIEKERSQHRNGEWLIFRGVPLAAGHNTLQASCEFRQPRGFVNQSRIVLITRITREE